MDVHEERQPATGRSVGRRQQKTPDLHAVEGSPCDRLQIADHGVSQLGIDIADRRRASAGDVEQLEVAHRTRVDALVREPPTIVADADVERVEWTVDALGFAIRDGHADDRLLEHVIGAGEGAVVRFQINRSAVARPHELVHPGVVEAEDARRPSR